MAEEDDLRVEELARLFTATREKMDGTAGPIERLIEEGDVVYGVWLDKTKPAGIEGQVGAARQTSRKKQVTNGSSESK